MSTEKVDELINYIFESVQLIVIICQNESFAIKLFQVLNDRGLDLTDADLFKSHLMSRLPSNQHDQFLGDWKWIENKLRDDEESGESVTDLLNHYLYFSKASNPEKGIYEELLALTKGKDANEVVFDLKKFCQSYRFVADAESKNIYALFSLRQELYWTSILMGAHYMGRTDIEELARLLRNFYYLCWIAGYSTPKVKQPSFNVLALVKNGATTQEIAKSLADSMKANDVFRRAKLAITGDVYREKWLKPLFYLLEYSLLEDAHINLSEKSDVHVEHVLPRSFSQPYWATLFSRDQAQSYLNSIANLTLLSGKQNIAASNEAFPKKIDIYNGVGRNSRATPFQLSQWIANRYAQEKSDWDVRALEARFAWIMQLLERELEVPFSEVSFSSVGNESTEIEEQHIETDKVIEPKSPKFTPVDFKDESVKYVSDTLGIKLSRAGKSKSNHLINGGPTMAICLASREYNDSKQGYWFAFHPHQRELLGDSEDNMLILACGSPDQVLLFKPNDFLKHVDRMNITENKNDDSMYWHIHVHKIGNQYFLRLGGGDRVDVTNFLLAESRKNIA